MSAGRIPVFVRVPDVPRSTEPPSCVKEVQVTPENIEDPIAFVANLKPR